MSHYPQDRRLRCSQTVFPLDADGPHMTSCSREVSLPMDENPGSVYDFSAPLLDGTPVALDRFRGRVLLIVNTASQCGYTHQYAGLESLYKSYKDRGLDVLGFPCNQFGAQEPGSA